MSIPKIQKFIGILMLPSLILAGCASAPTEEAQIKITSSGYECPAPEFRSTVTSSELRLFVWTEYIPLDMIECFELVYNVDVRRGEFSSSEEFFEKLSSNNQYDIVQPSDYMIAQLVRENYLQELDHSRLPVFANFDPNYLNLDFDPGNKYTIPYQAGTDALIVNTSRVNPLPSSWADLWNPEYAGRMVFLDDSRAVIGLTLLSLGYDVNSTDPAQLEQARAKLVELIPNIKLFDSDSPKTVLASGFVDLGMTWTAEAYLAQQENPSLRYIYPSEGAILWQDNWAISKNASNTDAAYAWLNYTMQGNVFWMMLRDFPYSNPNAAALQYAKLNHPELYASYFSSPITNTPADVLQKGHRIADVGEAANLYDDIWQAVRGE